MPITEGDIVIAITEDNNTVRAEVITIAGKLTTVKSEVDGDIFEVLSEGLQLAPMRIDFMDSTPTPNIKKTMDTLRDIRPNMLKSARVPTEKLGRKPQKPNRPNRKKNNTSDAGSGQPSADQLEKLMNRFNAR